MQPPLRNKIVQMKGDQQSQHTAYVELSDKYAQSVSRVAHLTAENERLRSERDMAGAAQGKADMQVQKLCALVNSRTVESHCWSESLRSLCTQNIIPSQSEACEK